MSHTAPEVVEYIPLATIDTVDDAMYNALNQLVGKVVDKVERYASVKGVPTQDEMLQILGSKAGVGVIFMQDRAPIKGTVETLALGTAERCMNVEWLVLLVVVDTRTPNKALKGTGTVSGIKGIYKLQTAVYAVLNGLEIPGMWHDSTVEGIGHQWAVTEPGKLYANIMRFTTGINVEVVPQDQIAHALDAVSFEFNLPEAQNDTVSTQTLIDSAEADTRP